MGIPTLNEAYDILEEAEILNPGAWIQHSHKVANAAKCIANECNLDSEKAYILGLLHDIGRRGGTMQARHALEGYIFMNKLGYDEVARICMSHTFQYKDINGIYDSWDCTVEELDFIKQYLQDVQYDEYDYLIQLCDALSLEKSYCFLEKKMVNSVIKFGYDIRIQHYLNGVLYWN